jgi:PAS domain S-box-containing protein
MIRWWNNLISAASRWSTVFSAMILTGVALAGYSLVVSETAAAQSRYERTIRQDARAIAQLVLHENLVQLNGTGLDSANADYAVIQRQLHNMLMANGRIQSIAILGRNTNGGIFYYVKSTAENTESELAPGQLYLDYPPSVIRVFNRNVEDYNIPINHINSGIASSVIPLIDAESGNQLAVLKIDHYVQQYYPHLLWQTTSAPSMLMLAFSVFGLLWLALGCWHAFRLERHCMHQALQIIATTQREHALIDIFPLPVFEIDEQGIIVHANTQAVSEFNLDPSVSEQRFMFTSLVDVADRAQVNDNLKQLIKGQWILGIEFEVNIVPNSRCPVLAFACPLIDARKVRGARIVMVNIRELKLTQNTLLESEFKYRTLFDAVVDAIYIMDGEFIIECNARCTELFGLSKDEIVGSRPEDLSPEYQTDGLKSRDRAIRIIADVYAKGTQHFEWCYKSSAASIVPTEVSLSRYQLKEQRYLIAVVRDITERQRTEAVLNRLFTAMEQAAEAVAICSRGWQLEYVNPAWERIAGVNSIEVLGKNWLELTPDGLVWALPEEALIAAANGTSWGGRMQINQSPNRPLVLEISVTAIKSTADELDGYVVVTKDVTREAAVEMHLHQAQKLEAIGTLAGGIAHDFNNILFAIMANAEMLQEDVASDNSAYENVSQILQASYRARDLIQQILTFSRQSKRKAAPFRPEQIVREVYRLLRSSLPSSLELKLELEPGNYTIVADPIELHQVLMNLCTNAAHAIEGDYGTICIGMKEVQADEHFSEMHAQIEPGAYLQLSVSDTGIGMSTEVRDRIFDPFFTTKDAGKGTGLGLAVVHGIIRELGGAISVYSEPGVGTTFQIYLPLTKSELVSDTLAVRTLPHGTERILVVDDEKMLLDVLEKMLTSLGYNVTCTSSGADALRLINVAAESFDLVITDLTMPRMRGDELARQVNRQCPDTPVILCTGFSQALSADVIPQHGVWATIGKPVSKSDLAWAVWSALHRSL